MRHVEYGGTCRFSVGITHNRNDLNLKKSESSYFRLNDRKKEEERADEVKYCAAASKRTKRIGNDGIKQKNKKNKKSRCPWADSDGFQCEFPVHKTV